MVNKVWLVWCMGPMDKEAWLHGVYGSKLLANLVASNVSGGSVTEVDVQYLPPQWIQQTEHSKDGYKEYSSK